MDFVVIYFLDPCINQKGKKKIKKIIGIQYIYKRRWHNGTKQMTKDWLRRFKKYKDLIIYFQLMKTLLTKKIQYKKEKFKIGCLRTQSDFVEILVEFMKGLIARKLIL
jgi:hypothetical protein